MKLVSEWISEHGTHDVLDDQKARKSFLAATGQLSPWSKEDTFVRRDMQQMVETRTLTGGELWTVDENVMHVDENVMHVSILTIAEACAAAYTPKPWHHGSYGMGFAVAACIARLKKYNS